MRLTPNQISAITEMLHEKLQFFDERGSPANGDVLNDIEKVLHNSFNNNLTDEVRSETLLCNSCDMPIKANDEKVRDPESDGEYMHVKCAVEESENEGFDDYMERRK